MQQQEAPAHQDDDDRYQIEQAQDMSRDHEQHSDKSAPISDSQVPQGRAGGHVSGEHGAGSPRGRALMARDASGQRVGDPVPLGRLTRSEE